MGAQIIMVKAGGGDCFVLQADDRRGRPWRALIDGGPPGTPRRALLPTLSRLDNADPLPLDLIAVTHVDNDHIGGVLELFDECVNGRARVIPRAVWHNSFTAVTHDRRLTSSAQLRRQIEAFSQANADLQDPFATRALVASISQGMSLAQLIKDLGLEGNMPFRAAVVQGPPAVWGDGGPTITAVAPDEADLERLHREWDRHVNTQMDPRAVVAAATNAIDTSVTNLSSLVLLIEIGAKRLLFTGDARGDRIVERLRAAGLLEGGDKIRLDALKVQHHGSERSCTADLFDAVVADHYLISGDGTHGNPSPETARRLCESLRGRRATVWLSHNIASVTSILRAHRNVTVRVCGFDSACIVVDL